ncbi:AAA family ATPase [Deferribacter autotrophicus]|uniref:AAA family ATPase n=1 Tax=Deferribacter autotrophicus TaxID=500465 RepID=UPI00165D7C47|nr:AAA family ATPase [Deferribacter autotrophicus]
MKVAVISGKGGTGKTTFAINFSKFLSKIGKKVLLADLDVEEPNGNLFFNYPLKYSESYTYIPKLIKENCAYCRECAEKCMFKALAVSKGFWMLFPELCHGCRACEYVCKFEAIAEDKRCIGKIGINEVNNPSFIEGRLNVGEVLTTSLIKDVKKKIKRIEEKYEVVVMDAPPGTSCPVIEVVKDVDKVIVVAEDSPFGFYDFTLIHDLLSELNKDYHLVINKFKDGKEIIPFCDKESINVLAKIPLEKNIAYKYSKGEFALDEYDEVFRDVYNKLIEVEN